MPGILCAVRGGKNSQITIDEAINLAEHTRLTLYFLYVVNLEFLSHTTTNRVLIARDEILKMGEFILLTAQERASKRGVPNVEVISREGEVDQEIIKLCHEIGANYVVLGSPALDSEKNFFTQERILKLATEIESSCQAKVIVAEGKANDQKAA